MPNPVDLDAESQELARDVALPAAARLDHQGDRIVCFRADRDDPAPQLCAGEQGIDDIEIVGRQQRCGDPPGQGGQPAAQCRRHMPTLAYLGV